MEKSRAQILGEQQFDSMLDPNGSYTQYGLTKREYFASQAMNSLASNEEWAKTMMITDDWDEYIKRLTEGAVDMADALLEALSKSK
jgi:hypothetical protein